MSNGLERNRHAAPRAGPPLWRRWTPGAARAVAVVLLAVLAVVIWWWWHGRPRSVDVVQSATASEVTHSDDTGANISASDRRPGDRSEMVTVHVIGRVREPGIVQVPEGSRVADAVAAAGGLRDRRAGLSINLARVVVDGEQIDVRRQARPGQAVDSSPADSAGGVINLNTASATTLETLPGIGPVLAGRIVAWRDANGRFPSVEVLGEVSGIGPALLSRLEGLVTV